MMGILTAHWLGETLRRQRLVIRFDQPEAYLTQTTVMSWFEHGGESYGGMLTLRYDNNGDYMPVTARLFESADFEAEAFAACRRWLQPWRRSSEVICTRTSAQGREDIPAINSLVLQSLARMEGMARAQGRAAEVKARHDLLWYTAGRIGAAVRQLNEDRARIVGAQG